MRLINILCFSAGLLFFVSQSEAEVCVPPNLTNGVVQEVSGSPSSNMYVGRFSCNPGHTLVGQNIIKCRSGKWSANLPVCTTVGKCDPALLHSIANGHKQRVKKFRGSVYKIKCFRGFERYGPSLVHCSGDSWNIDNLPVCTRPGCDSTNMESVLFGKSVSQENGAVREFSCDEGATLVGSSSIFCDGRDWNDTKPRCLKAPSRVLVTGPQKVRHGEQVKLECSTSPSFPSSSIKWRVQQSGKVVEFSNPQIRIMEEDDGSYVTQSILTTSVIAATGDLVAECYATNTVLGEDYRAYVHLIQVISAPSLPEIRGLPEGGVVPAEISLVLTCQATSGNPPAQLYWYKGDEMLQTETKLEGGVVRAVVEFVPHDDDIDLRCEAINEALSEPLTQSINIVVAKEPVVEYSQNDDFNDGKYSQDDDFNDGKYSQNDDFNDGYMLATTETHQIDQFTLSNQNSQHNNQNNIENYTFKEKSNKNIQQLELASSALISEDRAFKSAQVQSKANDKTLSLFLVVITLIATNCIRTQPTL